MKQLALSIFVIVVYALAGLGHAATLDSARQLYDSKDYRAAADQYGTLLSLNWPKTKLGELYDAYTECLMVTGQYDLAETKIDVFIKLMPGDSVVSKLTTRKQQIEAVKVISTIPNNVTRATADQQYADKNYKQAAAQYLYLSVQSATPQADIFDQLTESLFIAGQYKEAGEKIDFFLKVQSSDPLCGKLLVRKAAVDYCLNDFAGAIRSAQEALAKVDAQGEEGLQATKTLVESMSKAGHYQDLVGYVDQALAANASHPLYAELRRRQAEALATGLKDLDAARAKFVDAIGHADHESEVYEACNYRTAEVLLAQAKAVAQTDPQKADALTSASLPYFAEFLNHPGANQIYPANARQRLTALKRLKKFDQMEQEAARYLGADNQVVYTEVIAVRRLVGEYANFMTGWESGLAADDLAAIREIKDAYYGDDGVRAAKLAKDFMAQHAAEDAARKQAELLFLGAMIKSGTNNELVQFVDQTLAAAPDHALHAELRRAQADVYFDQIKDNAKAQTAYADAMAHSSNDTDLYEWCCYRAGDALFKQAQPLRGVDAQAYNDLKTRGRQYLQAYVDLPSKERIHPANVQRRLLAFNRLGQYDNMEREAAAYLTDEANSNPAVNINILRMLSVSRATRETPDAQGAIAAFEQLRSHQYEFDNVSSKLYCGISMVKAAESLHASGIQRAKLKACGQQFLKDCVGDPRIKVSNRLDAYYFLADWPGLKAEAAKHLDATATTDTATRAEMLNWIGISLAYQKDTAGALASFDKALQEYDKDPQAVEQRGLVSAYWGLHLKATQKDTAGAKAYLDKTANMPDCDLKTSIQQHYSALLAK